LQKSRFTASKPSIFAIASDEKFIRHLVTSFHQHSLSQSAYQNDTTKPNFGTLTATTYGNGAKISSRYDDFNRVTGVVYGEETAPRYEYDYNAKGQVARVRDNLLNRTTQSEYDLANRPVRVKTAEAGQHVYTGQVAYDNVYGNLSEFTEKVGENRQEFGTKFGYDDENRPTSLTYSASGKEIGQSTTTIDKLNRTTFSAVKLGSKTFTSEYHFAAGGYGTGSVTNLVASITQPGCNCGYGYDDNGNITSATLNGKWTGYTYDALGQLVQVNDHSDTRSGSNGTTWKYTYDLGGNILKKERFAYADTTTPLETVTYTYGDANWRDKLTAVNGSTIRYDAIGNPLNDGTWTYTWQNGRQLQKMQKSGVTAEFVYNADGLRVQKTVNGVATKYTLHGKNIVHMTSGTDELHFFYDAQNRPAVVVYNGTAYAYVKSLQGDILAILDENGNTVVSYGYDAWGAPLWCTGELAETLGKVQPFRYRGYVFDEETGLYYLRSRYYNPRWGRFANADAEIAVEAKLWDAKLFLYCANNPVRYTDDGGNSFWDVLADCGKALLVAAVVVAVVAVVIAATGGGGGFALAAAGGEIISGAAVADAAMTTAVAAGATGASLMFASRAGKKFEEDYYSNHYKSHNQAENGQFKEAVRRLKDNYDMNLTQDQQQRLHYAIRHKGYSLEEIIEEALNMFGE
jgi:RHS repeat-associated protein